MPTYLTLSLLCVLFALCACSNPSGLEERPQPGPIVFSSNLNQKNGNMALFIMNEDGTKLQQLTKESFSYIEPRWSPDGAKLVFSSTKNRTSPEGSPLFIMDVQTGASTQIADIGAGAVWSPDGEKIAYSKDPIYGGHGKYNIHILDLESKVERNIRANPSIHYGVDVWHPNGTMLLITSDDTTANPELDLELYLMKIEDGSTIRLTDNNVNDYGGRFSPGGSTIVYTSFAGSDRELFVMNADGSNKRNLTNDDKVFNSFPAWSPDGSKIIFSASDGPGVGGALNIINIYVINVDGTGLQRLTDGSVKGDINDAPDWRSK
jgi:TolB protein